MTRLVVFGAGAVGGVVAARVAQSGADVVAIARGAHLEAIRRDGLTIESPETRENVAVEVVDSPASARIGAGDVVLLAVKSQDTAAAVAALRESAPRATPVVCMQNGVANEASVLRVFENTYGICVMCPTGHLEPGVVQAYSAPVSGLLDIGRYPSGTDDTAESVASVLRAATFECEPRADIMAWKYRKLVMNLANAAEALCGPAARDGELVVRARAEGERCLDAAGIAVVGDEEDRARRGTLLRIRPIEGQRRGGGSTWQSLERRTGSVETDHLNGEIVLLGRLHGVPTPVNALLQELMADAARSATPPGTYNEHALLARLDA